MGLTGTGSLTARIKKVVESFRLAKSLTKDSKKFIFTKLQLLT